MNASSRFVVAVHILAALELAVRYGRQGCVTSEFLASSVNTNPVVIRRILSRLRQVGLVESQPGAQGGSSLLVEPKSISLLSVFEAVEEGSLFHLHYADPNPECPVGANIQQALAESLERSEAAMKAVLAESSLDDILEKLRLPVEEYLAEQPQ